MYTLCYGQKNFRNEKLTREEAWKKHLEPACYEFIPRINYAALSEMQIILKLSQAIAAMEYLEKQRCDGWPDGFADEFHDKILQLHIIDEKLRYRNRMPPRLGNKKFPAHSPNAFRGHRGSRGWSEINTETMAQAGFSLFPDEQPETTPIEYVDANRIQKTTLEQQLPWLVDYRKQLEELEKDNYQNDDPKTHKRNNVQISLLIELEKRVAENTKTKA